MESDCVAAQRRWSTFTVGCLLTIAGCGGADSPAYVSGTVLHRDGTPLVNAKLLARSEETGKTGTGITDDKGHYEMVTVKLGDGISAGNYHIAINEDSGDPDHRNPATISAKYRNPATSGLQINVKAGDSTVFDAKLDPP